MTLRASTAQPIKLSAATQDDLRAADTAYLVAGDLAFVVAEGLFYRYDPTSLAAASGTVLLTANSNAGALGGRWILQPGMGGYSTQATWYIDAVAGSDENDGATALTALATWAEFARRVRFISQNTTVNLLTDLAANDPIVGSISSISGLYTLSIIGTPTVLDTGVIATRANPTIANAEGTLTSVAIPDWTVGAIVEVTASGTPTDVGLATVVLAEGAADTAQVPFWVTDSLTQLPAVGATIRMFNGSEGYYIQLDTQNVIVSVRYVAFSGIGASNYVRGLAAYFRECQFDGTVESSFSQSNYIACAFLANADLNAGTTQNAAYVSGGAILAAQTFTQWGAIRFDGTISYGAIVLGSDRGGAFVALEGNGLGVFNSAAAGITVGAASEMVVGATAPSLYGDGNTTYGLLVRDGGKVRIDTSLPSITGTTAAVSLDGQTHCVQNLTAGDGAVPAAVPLSTWDHWKDPFAGPGFNRSAINWAWTAANTGAANGSAIIGT